MDGSTTRGRGKKKGGKKKLEENPLSRTYHQSNSTRHIYRDRELFKYFIRNTIANTVYVMCTIRIRVCMGTCNGAYFTNNHQRNL